MLVYRFENEAGVGPYTGITKFDISTVVPGLDRNGSSRHPSPAIDFSGDTSPWVKGMSRYNSHFGFSTLHQLMDWFDPLQQIQLADLGFHLTTYQVDPEHVVLLNRQCAFVRKHARRLQSDY